MHCLLNHIANSTLRIRSTGVEWDGMQHFTGKFRAQQNKADLRPIPMCDDDIPALSDHLSDMYRCFTHSIKLVGNAFMGFVFDERVTANGDNCKLGHFASRNNGSIA